RHCRSGVGPELPQADVDDDAVQPGRELGLALECAEGTKRTQKGVLDGVGAVFFGAKETARDGQEPGAVALNESFEGLFIAGLELGHEDGFRVGRENLVRMVPSYRHHNAVHHDLSLSSRAPTKPEQAVRHTPSRSNSWSKRMPATSTNVTAARSKCSRHC